MDYFIRVPGEEVFPGVRVKRGMELCYENDHVKQRLQGMQLVTEACVVGEGFESHQRTVIDLKEGDILIFEDGRRGYIKPAEAVCSVDEGILALNDLRALGVRL